MWKWTIMIMILRNPTCAQPLRTLSHSPHRSVSDIPHNRIPHGARSAPLRAAEKHHYSPESLHPRQRTHVSPDCITRRIFGVFWPGGENGDERGAEAGKDVGWIVYQPGGANGQRIGRGRAMG